MFQLICAAEEAFLSLAKHNGIFLRDAFEAILLILSAKKLPLIGCSLHTREMISSVIFQYLTLRFRCYAKKKLIGVIEQKRTESQANMKKKLKKMIGVDYCLKCKFGAMKSEIKKEKSNITN